MHLYDICYLLPNLVIFTVSLTRIGYTERANIVLQFDFQP